MCSFLIKKKVCSFWKWGTGIRGTRKKETIQNGAKNRAKNEAKNGAKSEAKKEAKNEAKNGNCVKNGAMAPNTRPNGAKNEANPENGANL